MNKPLTIAMLALLLGMSASSARAEYPQTLTVVSPFVNLPRPDWDPRWAQAFSHWDQRERDREVFAALRIFESLAQSHPDRAEIHLWLCRAFNLAAMRSREPTRRRHLQAAIQHADRALKLDPENDYARFWRYGTIALVRDFTAEEFEEVRAWARQFEELRELPLPGDDPLWAEAMIHWDRRLERGELEKTIAIFHELAKKNPGRIEPKMWLSRAYYWMHYHEETDAGQAKWCQKAMEWGQKAVEMEPRNPAANYWTAAAIGQYSLSSGFTAIARNALEIARRLQVVGEEDINYYFGGLSQYFALAIANSGPLAFRTLTAVTPGGYSEEDIRRLTVFAHQYEPRYLRNSYALGEFYLSQQNMEEAKRYLEFTVNADPAELKNFEPDNRIAQKLSRELLDKHF